MGTASTAIRSRFILLALCLTWNCPFRGWVQESSPPSSSIDTESLHGGFDFSCNGFESEWDTSDDAVVGEPEGSDTNADDESELSQTKTASQPPAFGGPLHSRPKLTGDWCGLREHLRDHGITLDVSATTYYMGIASGGLEETFEFGGRDDYLLNVDGQKVGLWQGLSANLHGETVYGDSVNDLTGAVVPVNIGRAHPVFFGTETALTGVKFTQVLSEHHIVYAGKINTIDNVQQPFMPGRGLDAGFMNAAFVFNPILGRTIPYSTFGVGGAILAHGQPVITLTVYDTKDHSTTSVFDDLFEDGAIIYPTISLPTNFCGMPGHQSLWGAYSTGTYDILDPQALLNFPPPLPVPPPTIPVNGSWWITYLFDQTLWVDHSDQTRSWGVFGNFGISGGDPNPIDWSIIVGIGGSSPISHRTLDTFGVAYYYLSVSDDLKRLVEPILPLRDERGLELFYNFGVTPWCHVTADLQVITPVIEQADTSLVLGLRAKFDF